MGSNLFPPTAISKSTQSLLEIILLLWMAPCLGWSWYCERHCTEPGTWEHFLTACIAHWPILVLECCLNQPQNIGLLLCECHIYLNKAVSVLALLSWWVSVPLAGCISFVPSFSLSLKFILHLWIIYSLWATSISIWFLTP